MNTSERKVIEDMPPPSLEGLHYDAVVVLRGAKQVLRTGIYPKDVSELIDVDDDLQDDVDTMLEMIEFFRREKTVLKAPNGGGVVGERD